MRCILLILVAIAVLSPAPAHAHIVREEPWAPMAHAYRQAVFLLNLKPVPWARVETAFAAPGREAVTDTPAFADLEALDAALDTDHVPTIRSAIAAGDAQALYAAATRAMAAGIRMHLERAGAASDDPAAARREIARAQALYRAFADFVRKTQPDAARELGRAWLRLNTAAGASGVDGVGELRGDRTAFAEAKATILDYVARNFDPARFRERAAYAPLPETFVANGGDRAVQPWLPPGAQVTDPRPLPRLVLNLEERGIAESDVPMVAYGDMLFDSPRLFGEPARSLAITCSSCHPRSDRNVEFVIPGISHQPGAVDVDAHYFNPMFDDRKTDPLDIPSLRGLRFTAPYGRDGRFASLREFTRNVVVNEFGGPEPTPFMLDSLVQYLLEFDFLPTPYLHPDGTLKANATDAAKRGAEIFRRPFPQMAGQSCASCHPPSSHFTDNAQHDIGSMRASYADSVDGALVTPSLLGVKHTAPYFHAGSLATLADVVAWFDEEHGLALGARERRDLTAYLEAVGTGTQPFHEFEGKQTAFRLGFEELSTFLSTMDALLPRRDRFHITLLLKTVADDLAADASGMANTSARDEVYALADRLRAIEDAVAAEDWDRAERRWSAYKQRQSAVAPKLY